MKREENRAIKKIYEKEDEVKNRVKRKKNRGREKREG